MSVRLAREALTSPAAQLSGEPCKSEINRVLGTVARLHACQAQVVQLSYFRKMVAWLLRGLLAEVVHMCRAETFVCLSTSNLDLMCLHSADITVAGLFEEAEQLGLAQELQAAKQKLQQRQHAAVAALQAAAMRTDAAAFASALSTAWLVHRTFFIP